MLCQRSGDRETGAMLRPFGRGVMFQILVDALQDVERRLARAGHPLHTGPREVWRRCGEREYCRREIVAQDPDGYLVMIAQNVGQRPPGAACV